MNVLVAKRDGESAEELRERKREGMIEQRLDRNLPQTETAEKRAEVVNGVREPRLVVQMRRIASESQCVIEREGTGFADELGEEAGESGARHLHDIV